MTLGRRIKQLRLRAEMTQEDLGNRMGYAKQTISQYETGRREPSNSDLQKLADIFDVSIDDLLGNVKAPPDSMRIVIYGSDGRLIDISSLSNEDQEYIISLAERFKAERRK